eukprot:GILI01004928.1.p1 GENE.GILI01004928.1~~GILI01004928.1.p1  ORF type:complete len:1978 (-),score=477.28 GILI01004928.1:192-5717(-)
MLRVKLQALSSATPKDRPDSILSLVELDLLRGGFAKDSLKGFSNREVSSMYLAFLNGLLEVAKESPAATASVLVALGKYYANAPVASPLPADGQAPPEDDEERRDLPNAVAFLERALKACTNAENPSALANAETSLIHITMPTLTCRTETVISPSTAILVSTESKCLDSLSYCMYAVSRQADEVFGSKNHAERRAYIASLPAVGSVHQVSLNRPSGDYYPRSVEFVAEGIKKPGRYVLAIWDSAKQEDAQKFVINFFNVSGIAFLRTQVGQKNETLITVDRMTGEPLTGVKVDFYTRSWSDGRSKRDHITSQKSDANGFLIPSLPSDRHTEMTFTLGDDILDVGDYYYSRDDKEYPNPTQYQTFFFTDRNIYRPSQTIYFKGLHVRTNPDGMPAIEKSCQLVVTFHDANYQAKDTVTVTTNEFGTFEGTFTAPSDGLTGQMSIGTPHGTAGFRVEEYKRPRFEVTLSTPAQTVRVGGKAKVVGKAMNFSGIPLAGATIKYRVRRTARAPWFWGFWCRVPRWSGASAEILNDTVVADEKGSFEVIFDAVPDMDLPAEGKPEFDFEVVADVTDITGETQSGRTSMKVGYLALSVDLPLSDKMDAKSLRELAVSLTDLNGNPIAASAEITLEALVTPHPLGCPFINRYWKSPDSIALDKASFKKLLPQYAYSDEADPAKWARKGEKLSRSVTSTGATAAIVTDLHKGQLQPDTYYRVTLTAKDSFGTPVTVSRTVCLFDTESPASVSASSAQMPSLHFTQTSYRVKQLAVVRYGKRLRFDGSSQPLLICLGSASQPGTFEWDRTKGSNGVLVQERAVPVMEADRGSVVAVSAFVAYNRMFTSTESASIPWVEKELAIEYVTFRDRLEPGQQEQWRLKIKSADPQAPDQAIVAEVVAALYDASLDKLKGNHEHNFSNGANGLFPFKSPVLCASTGSGFHNTDSTELQAPKPSRQRQYHHYDNYCQLDWFSFPFRSERPAPVFLAQKMCRNMVAGGAMRAMSYGAPPGGPNVMLCAAPCAAPAPAMAMAKGGMARTREVVAMADNDNDTRAPNDAPVEEEEYVPTVRTNLKETVFFLPNLRTEADGTVVLNFTMGEALTRWRLLAFAHTADLKVGTHSDGSIITQKEVMVTPNPPRFLREGDSISFAAKVSNMGADQKDGSATLEILDGISGEPINSVFGLSATASVPFSCAGNGQSAAVSWPLKVPYGGPSVVTWRIIAKCGRSGDGEESALPVVTNRMLVTDTLPMSVRGGKEKQFTLKSLANNTSDTLSHEAFTVEFTSNPAWYAVQALPYMMEFPHECSEQLFTRYYSNTLATHVTRLQPQIQKVFEAWRLLGSDALKSNLSKNEELKSALQHETPWVLEAQSEEQQKKQIALLFDLNRMASEGTRAVDKLRGRQQSDGGFSWFPGGRSSRYITQHIAMGLAHLAHLGVSEVASDIQLAAQDHCYRALVEDYEDLLKLVAEGKAKLEDCHLSHIALLFLYTESFSLLHPQFKARATRRAEVLDYYRGQAATYWTKFNLYSQGHIALIHHRYQTHPNIPVDIVKSLRERSLSHEEMGTYWKQNPGYYFYEAPIETHALMIEVFREVAADPDFVDELRLWLLKNKQTKHWKTTKQTSEAVYALLLGGESWLESTQLVSVKVGDKPLPMVNPEPGTGYIKHRYSKDEITNQMGSITVTNPNKVVAWGAAYWQYFESLDKIQWFQETPLKIKKEVTIVKVTEKGDVLRPLGEGNSLTIGDKVRIRIEIRVDREMDYVHLKDMRASGLEPVNVLSSYKWQDGLGYYESTKDLATHFFIDHLPKGTFVFEYTLVASQKGEFSNGVTTMQSMYAPEFTSHSEGIRLQIA